MCKILCAFFLKWEDSTLSLKEMFYFWHCESTPASLRRVTKGKCAQSAACPWSFFSAGQHLSRLHKCSHYYFFFFSFVLKVTCGTQTPSHTKATTVNIQKHRSVYSHTEIKWSPNTQTSIKSHLKFVVTINGS